MAYSKVGSPNTKPTNGNVIFMFKRKSDEDFLEAQKSRESINRVYHNEVT